MKATRRLPENYRPAGGMDLARNLKALIWLNILGAGLFIVFGGLFLWAFLFLRPEASAAMAAGISGEFHILQLVVYIIGLTAVMLVLHEALHGLFFWIFTRARPKFGLGGGYAYASAPGWFLPRRQYWVVGLAPLVGISAIGLGLVMVLPPGWFLALWALLTFNASGAVGDLAVCAWLIKKPAATLVEDQGDAVWFYAPW